MATLREALIRHAKYYAEFLRLLQERFRVGEGDVDSRVRHFNENWEQLRSAQTFCERQGEVEVARLFQDGNLATLNIAHQELLDFDEAIKEYATLFGTRYFPDVLHAEKRFGLLIDQSMALGRYDLREAIASALHKQIRSLRATENPHDPTFEVLFRLLARADCPASTTVLLEMMQWAAEDMNYISVREMAAETLAAVSDPDVPARLLKVAQSRHAPRSARRCAVYGLCLMHNSDIKPYLLSLKNDPVVSDLISV